MHAGLRRISDQRELDSLVPDTFFLLPNIRSHRASALIDALA